MDSSTAMFIFDIKIELIGCDRRECNQDLLCLKSFVKDKVHFKTFFADSDTEYVVVT